MLLNLFINPENNYSKTFVKCAICQANQVSAYGAPCSLWMKKKKKSLLKKLRKTFVWLKRKDITGTVCGKPCSSVV